MRVERNGDPAWNSLALAVEKIREDTTAVRERIAVVETKLDDLPCVIHGSDINRLKSASSKWGDASKWAVALTAIGAIVWKVLG